MFIDNFQEKIWKDKYQYNNETFEEYCNRIASNIFKDDEKRRNALFNYLFYFKVLFGGRINSNIGISERGLTLFNCFISAMVKNPDSLEGIFELATRYAITLKTEGGVGFCANFLRPANTMIRKIGVTSPGSVKFLELFDKISEIITSGSVDKDNSYQGIPTKNSIRKGATMATMSICHPDIEEFIIAKSIPNRLTKMNMSVLITDAFIHAVENDSDWDLWFPDINFEKYEDEWDGNFEKWAEKNYPHIVYKTVKAAYLWNLLLKNTHNRNEPGIIFIDNARRMDNLHYLEGCSMTSCNPCAEVLGNTGKIKIEEKELLLGDVCNLGSINLTKFYNIETKEFDYKGFMDAIAILVRALDNVIEISNYPLSMYENAAKLKRKIGVGFAGTGSLMMMMGVGYGSKECLDFLKILLKKAMNKLYSTSAILAKEKGPFALYSKELLNDGYIKNSNVLTKETINLIKKHGLRHSALSAIAPNGTLSIIAGNISGGLEPVFDKEFIRWNRVEGKKVDFKYPDIHKGEWFETGYLKEEEVGDEVILMATDGKYRVDKNNGLCKKAIIRDYGYNIALENGFKETTCARELSIKEHLNVLATFAKFVDQSCSKTINLPNDVSFDDFKKLYNKIHSLGIKGCTTYRDGSSVGILETEKNKTKEKVKYQQKKFIEAFKNQEEDDVVVSNVKLPEEYPAKGYILQSEGKKWYVHVAFKDIDHRKPFAVFVNTNHREDNVLTFDALDKLVDLALYSGLEEELIEEVKRKYAYQKNPVKICRMLGLLLRHNIKIYDIVKKMDEVEQAIPGTFVFRIKKFLSKFIDEDDFIDGMRCIKCGSKSLTMQQGCIMCTKCLYSKCE